MQEADSGTQVAVINTEHSLSTQATVSTYVLVVDTSEMLAGDTLELRAKVKTLGASTSALAYIETLDDVQDAPVFMSVPVPTVHEVEFTLRQTTGTGRSYDWSVVALA